MVSHVKKITVLRILISARICPAKLLAHVSVPNFIDNIYLYQRIIGEYLHEYVSCNLTYIASVSCRSRVMMRFTTRTSTSIVFYLLPGPSTGTILCHF